MQAMFEAAKQDLTDAKGLKTLLVLTDGQDSELKKNKPKYNPEHWSVPEFIVNKFKPLNVRVNMIFFTPAGKPSELAQARKDFEGALSRLEPKGSFVKADDLPELKDTLRRGIRQKLTYQILKPDKTPVTDQLFDVTGPSDVDRWSIGLKPGSYFLRVHADQNYDKEIDLKPGDRIIVNLVDASPRGIAFQRALYSDGDEFAHDIKQDQDRWRMSVLANKLTRQGQAESLRIFGCLERKPADLDPDRIRQVKPRLAWFRIEADDGDRSPEEFSLRWHERMFYPGPVWQLDVPQWIKDIAGTGPARPRLNAWWCNPEDNPSPVRRFSLSGAGNARNLSGTCPVDDGKTVRIESIEIEDHPIEVAPGKPMENKSCLVVRLAFPENSPYIVDPKGLEGVETAGFEHRLYTRANKYTGLFWPVNEPQFQQFTKLSLISLDAFRSEASKQKNTAEFKLKQPRDDDPTPDPLVSVGAGPDPAP